MARPYKKGLDYFAMDTDFDQDDKIGVILELYGNEGVGVLVRLWARMYRTDDGILDLSDPAALKYLCRQLAISPKKFEKIIEISAKLGLFSAELWRDYHRIVSNRVQTSIKNINQHREKNRVNRHETEELSSPITPQQFCKGFNKVKVNIKEKENNIKEIVKENKENAAVTATTTATATEIITKKIDEKTTGEIFTLYEQEIGVLTPVVADEVKIWLNEYSPEHIKEAIKEASLSGVRKPAYIGAILQNWKTGGYKNHRPRSPTGSNRAGNNGVQTAEEMEAMAKRMGIGLARGWSPQEE